MTGFNHGMTGAVIALTVKNPVLAVPLSFVSHFLTDLIPHFHNMAGSHEEYLFKKRFNIFLVFDFLFSVFLMIVLASLFPSQKWLIWSCMIAAAIPDAASAYYRLYGERIKKTKLNYDPLYRLHIKIQWSETDKGALLELGWFVLMWTLVLIIKK